MTEHYSRAFCTRWPGSDHALQETRRGDPCRRDGDRSRGHGPGILRFGQSVIQAFWGIFQRPRPNDSGDGRRSAHPAAETGQDAAVPTPTAADLAAPGAGSLMRTPAPTQPLPEVPGEPPADLTAPDRRPAPPVRQSDATVATPPPASQAGPESPRTSRETATAPAATTPAAGDATPLPTLPLHERLKGFRRSAFDDSPAGKSESQTEPPARTETASTSQPSAQPETPVRTVAPTGTPEPTPRTPAPQGGPDTASSRPAATEPVDSTPAPGPAIERRDPPAESRQPVIERRDPPAEPRQPVMERRDPPAESRQPVMERRDPPAETPQPAVERRDPPAERTEPPAESRPAPKAAGEGEPDQNLLFARKEPDPQHRDGRTAQDPRRQGSDVRSGLAELGRGGGRRRDGSRRSAGVGLRGRCPGQRGRHAARPGPQRAVPMDFGAHRRQGPARS